MQSLGDKDAAVLECLRSERMPMGSWNLADKLQQRGISASSATIGRILNGLEHAGLVCKDGNNGRTITGQGIAALDAMRVNEHFMQHTRTLEQLITTDTLEDYILVLEARKVIEGEAARMAATNISDRELQLMEEILFRQNREHDEGGSVTDTEVAFHHALAEASGNKVLEALYMMLFSYDQQTEIYEHIRAEVEPVYISWHEKILDALKKHDPAEAKRCVEQHMDSLIGDVTKYWSMFQKS